MDRTRHSSIRALSTANSPDRAAHGPGVAAIPLAERVITLADTCDLVAPEASSESVPERRYALLVFFGAEAQVCLLEEGTTVILGREPPCEILVKDASISRQHARFSMKNGEIWVEDLDSRNGTQRGGQSVRHERLSPTDELRIGTARVVVAATRPGVLRALASEHEAGPVAHVVHGPLMKTLYQHVARVAQTNLSVLILGESGVGKEHVAGSVHRQGSRRDRPFVVVNCAAIPPSLIEATLFGHERGAFTGAVGKGIGMFERANGGTLFLDEVGELTSTAQAALLRVVEAQRVSRVGSSLDFPIDVRLVAATHCDLSAMVADGTFRQDLYFRLSGVELVVPPIRERADEIEVLVAHFLARVRREWDVRARHVSADALDALRSYGWPGNVRQLRHAIERAALLCTSETIGRADLPDYVLSRAPNRQDSNDLVTGLTDLSLREQLTNFERALIEEALRRTGGNRRAASKILRIPLRTLFRKLRVLIGTDDAEEGP